MLFPAGAIVVRRLVYFDRLTQRVWCMHFVNTQILPLYSALLEAAILIGEAVPALALPWRPDTTHDETTDVLLHPRPLTGPTVSALLGYTAPGEGNNGILTRDAALQLLQPSDYTAPPQAAQVLLRSPLLTVLLLRSAKVRYPSTSKVTDVGSLANTVVHRVKVAHMIIPAFRRGLSAPHTAFSTALKLWLTAALAKEGAARARVCGPDMNARWLLRMVRRLLAEAAPFALPRDAERFCRVLVHDQMVPLLRAVPLDEFDGKTAYFKRR